MPASKICWDENGDQSMTIRRNQFLTQRAKSLAGNALLSHTEEMRCAMGAMARTLPVSGP